MPGGIDYDYEDLHKDARVPEPDTVHRRGLRTLTGLITALFTIFLVAVVALGAGFVYLQSELKKDGPLAAEKMVLVERGQGTVQIAETLQYEGAITSDKVFLLGVMANRVNGKLKAGEYRIAANASMIDIIDMLVAGRSVQHKITIPEGLTTAQILKRVEEHDILEGEVEGEVPEGALLPDTYSFPRGMTRQEVIDRMRNAQKKLLADLWSKRSDNLPLSSPEEAVILASIVEKETGLTTERRRVAGVFVNRLRQRMRLQSDPTIVYGIVGGDGPLGRPILKSDISRKTAYNTYQIDGLPPTPIANPGRAAIEAVLNPADTKDLFFVADGTGGHAFAETLAQHNQNVARWREIERQRNAPQETPADDAAPTSADATQPDSTEQAETPADTTTSDNSDQTAALQPGNDTDANQPAANSDTDQAADNPDAPAESRTDDTNGQPEPDDNASTDADATEPDASPAPDAQADAQSSPSPEPETSTGSEIAKATIEKAPVPKPKPPVPQRRESAVAPEPAPQPQAPDAAQPDTPDADADDAAQAPIQPTIDSIR